MARQDESQPRWCWDQPGSHGYWKPYIVHENKIILIHMDMETAWFDGMSLWRNSPIRILKFLLFQAHCEVEVAQFFLTFWPEFSCWCLPHSTFAGHPFVEWIQRSGWWLLGHRSIRTKETTDVIGWGITTDSRLFRTCNGKLVYEDYFPNEFYPLSPFVGASFVCHILPPRANLTDFLGDRRPCFSVAYELKEDGTFTGPRYKPPFHLLSLFQQLWNWHQPVSGLVMPTTQILLLLV